jgi:hypothetical protein
MTHNTSRICTRCGKELTDAASMEAGIGPVCRDLDNALLARLIPSDVVKARATFDNVDLTAVAPETLKTLNEVYGALFADDAMAREDWRAEVKRIEWSLSHPSNNYMRGDLTSVVAALGYIGLAALWNGEAKTGKAMVTFMNNRIVVQAANCKAARATFRSIPGRIFHSVGTLTPKAAWSFPAKQFEAAYLAVIKHYPNFEGLNEAIEQAKKFVPPSASVKVPAPVVKAVLDMDSTVANITPIVAYDIETTPPALDPAFEGMSAAATKNIFAAMGLPPNMIGDAVAAANNAMARPTPAPAPVAAAPAPAKKAPKCSITPVGVLLKVQIAYDKVKTPAYVDELKATVTWTDRRWNKQESCWEIVASHADKVKALITKHFGAEALSS